MISEDMTYIEEDIHPYIPTHRHIHTDDGTFIIGGMNSYYYYIFFFYP